MRRRFWRFAWRTGLALAVLGVLAGLLAAPVGVKAFHRACDGSLEGLRYLSSVREQLAAATAPPPTPVVPPTATPAPPTPTPLPTMTPAVTATAPPTATPTPTPTPPPPAGPTLQQRGLEAVGVVGDAALAGLVRVKQADAVAYPLHIVTAHALDAAGCPEDAIRLQWLKAGLHASRAGQPEQVAAALTARASAPDQLADLRRVVHTWTLRAHDNEPLKRVFAALN